MKIAPAVISYSRRLVPRACPGRSAARSGALQTPISGLPEIGAHMRASRASPTCVDRSSPWRSRISGAPLRSAPRCIASGTHDTDGHSCLTTSNNTHSLVAARFCVNALSPQHALAGPIPVFSCFSADSDLPSRVLRSQTTRTSPFQHALPPSRGAFCARGLHRCFTHPESRGGRSAEKRSGARRNTRGAYHDAIRQAPSEAPCVP